MKIPSALSFDLLSKYEFVDIHAYVYIERGRDVFIYSVFICCKYVRRFINYLRLVPKNTSFVEYLKITTFN